jgi:hypothetical protein
VCTVFEDLAETSSFWQDNGAEPRIAGLRAAGNKSVIHVVKPDLDVLQTLTTLSFLARQSTSSSFV